MRLIDAVPLIGNMMDAIHDGYNAEDMLSIVNEQPTVDAVPVVHGEWIPQGSVDAEGNQYYTCSVCQCGEVHFPSVKVSFCWNCGAKMDLTQSNDSTRWVRWTERRKMDKELKPCPFCGKPVNIYYSSATEGYYVVHTDEQHSNCMVLMPLSINHNRILLSLAEAYASWNDRP